MPIDIHSAAQRIKNQLTYKLGEKVMQTKGFFAFLILPLTLLKICYLHKKEQKTYKEKFKKENLIPLHECKDYKEALKIKNQLTYRLGELFLKSLKNTTLLWGGGLCICKL